MSRKHIGFEKMTVASLALLGMIGCSSQGLSSRESGAQTYSNVVYPAPAATGNLEKYTTMTGATPLALPTTGPVHLNLPARVSLAQVGEIVPPQSMLESLRAAHGLFRQVSPQSGIIDTSRTGPREGLNQMRTMAENVGSDYLLVFGGNVDSGSQGTGLDILNLTIIGAFIAPGTAVAVDGKAAGSLVDVHTGRVLMNFSSGSKGHGLTPTAFAENVETASVAIAKEELVKKLTDDVISQLTEQSKSGVAIAK